jgi:hypothetical protein
MEKIRTCVAVPVARKRRPVHVIIVARDGRMRGLLGRAVRDRFPGVIFTIVEEASDACGYVVDADPYRGDIVPKVIVYCASDHERPAEIWGYCGAIYGSGPKAKRWAPKIVIYATYPMHRTTLFESTIVMQPHLATLFETIEGFLPQHAKKRKE